MAVLVTGGAGFIGSSLLDRLVARGEECVCWDNFNDYYDPRIKRGNVARLVETRKITLIEGDICDTELGERVFGGGRIKTVVHLAARAGVRPSLEQPLLYERVNCRGTVNLLDLARRHGVKKFVFGSSSSVYGNNAKIPFSEEDPVNEPISPYAATKRAGELFCRTCHHLYGLSVVCLRFFTVYGPRGRPDMAIYGFTDRMMRGEPINVYGDGTSRRDYTFISDVLDGVTAAMDRDVGFDIINLGESNTVELRYLIELIAKATGKTPRLNHVPMQPGDVNVTCADISKARRLLGYDPGFPIEKGIPIFVEWYKQNVRDGD